MAYESPIKRNHWGKCPGFTLLEVLIVVIILGLLAALVVPQFTSAAGGTRESSIRTNLFRVRSQIEIYKQQHGGSLPTLVNFINQMTKASNMKGETAEPGTNGFDFGPYIREIPINSNTSTNNVGNGQVGTSAWHYDEVTGNFHANDSDETRLF